jgi:hypothetical protein
MSGSRGDRQDARRRDHERGHDLAAVRGAKQPLRRVLVERHLDDLGVQEDVAPEVEAVGDEVQVALDLRLCRHRFGPHPLLLDLVGEAVGVLDALDVAARTRVPVEQPGASDRMGLLEDHRA